MGDQGTLLISESEVNYAGHALSRSERAGVGRVGPEGLHHARRRSRRRRPKSDAGAIADVRESVAPDQHTVPVTLRDPYHQPHLQNFFDAVRGKATLNCPAEVAYETAVAVLKVNEAIEAKTPAGVQARRLQDLTGRRVDHRTDGYEALAIRPMSRDHAVRCAIRDAVGWHFLYEGIAKLTVAVVVGGRLHARRRAGRSRRCSTGSRAAATCSTTPT